MKQILRLTLKGNGTSFPRKLSAAYILRTKIFLSFISMKHSVPRPVAAPQDWFCHLPMGRPRQIF